MSGEWWNEEIRELNRKKRETYGRLLQKRRENVKKMYKMQKMPKTNWKSKSRAGKESIG